MVSNSTLKRYAFTLIELIFAIVVIAISVISLPMMTQVTSKGIEKNLVQEAIFASVAEINMATTYIWDENSFIDDNESSSNTNDLSRVLWTGTTNDCTGPVGGIHRRGGHINRRCIDNNDTRIYTGVNYLNALEAAVGANQGYKSIYDIGGKSAEGYKELYTSRLDVVLCNPAANCQQFGDGTNDSNFNLKEISVTVQNSNGDIVTLLRTYSANIGEVPYAREPL